jgi:hypothetical protein
MNANIRYFAKSTWDELLILGTLAKVTYDNAPILMMKSIRCFSGTQAHYP